MDRIPIEIWKIIAKTSNELFFAQIRMINRHFATIYKTLASQDDILADELDKINFPRGSTFDLWNFLGVVKLSSLNNYPIFRISKNRLNLDIEKYDIYNNIKIRIMVRIPGNVICGIIISTHFHCMHVINKVENEMFPHDFEKMIIFAGWNIIYPNRILYLCRAANKISTKNILAYMLSNKLNIGAFDDELLQILREIHTLNIK